MTDTTEPTDSTDQGSVADRIAAAVDDSPAEEVAARARNRLGDGEPPGLLVAALGFDGLVYAASRYLPEYLGILGGSALVIGLFGAAAMALAPMAASLRAPEPPEPSVAAPLLGATGLLVWLVAPSSRRRRGSRPGRGSCSVSSRSGSPRSRARRRPSNRDPTGSPSARRPTTGAKRPPPASASYSRLVSSSVPGRWARRFRPCSRSVPRSGSSSRHCGSSRPTTKPRSTRRRFRRSRRSRESGRSSGPCARCRGPRGRCSWARR
ncbi:hypothetical protein ACFQL4_17250 [Halosimplex aquaticum]